MESSTFIGIGIAAIFLSVLIAGLVYISARVFSRVRAPVVVEAPPAILENVSSFDGAVIIVRKGGKALYINDRARELFGFNGEVPDLNRMARMAQPHDAFLELFATEGQASVTVANRPLEATSVRVPG
ncbi:MAG: hypothetical protein AABZ58_08220 [Chloroflexota bacterium]